MAAPSGGRVRFVRPLVERPRPIATSIAGPTAYTPKGSMTGRRITGVGPATDITLPFQAQTHRV